MLIIDLVWLGNYLLYRLNRYLRVIDLHILNVAVVAAAAIVVAAAAIVAAAALLLLYTMTDMPLIFSILSVLVSFETINCMQRVKSHSNLIGTNEPN